MSSTVSASESSSVSLSASGSTIPHSASSSLVSSLDRPEDNSAQPQPQQQQPDSHRVTAANANSVTLIDRVATLESDSASPSSSAASTACPESDNSSCFSSAAGVSIPISPAVDNDEEEENENSDSNEEEIDENAPDDHAAESESESDSAQPVDHTHTHNHSPTDSASHSNVNLLFWFRLIKILKIGFMNPKQSNYSKIFSSDSAPLPHSSQPQSQRLPSGIFDPNSIFNCNIKFYLLILFNISLQISAAYIAQSLFYFTGTGTGKNDPGLAGCLKSELCSKSQYEYYIYRFLWSFLLLVASVTAFAISGDFINLVLRNRIQLFIQYKLFYTDNSNSNISNNILYRIEISNLIPQIDQRITSDIQFMLNSICCSIFGNSNDYLAYPIGFCLFRILFATLNVLDSPSGVRLSANQSLSVVGSALALMALSMIGYLIPINHISSLVHRGQQLQGEFHSVHSRCVLKSEEICLFDGEKEEKRQANNAMIRLNQFQYRYYCWQSLLMFLRLFCTISQPSVSYLMLSVIGSTDVSYSSAFLKQFGDVLEYLLYLPVILARLAFASGPAHRVGEMLEIIEIFEIQLEKENSNKKNSEENSKLRNSKIIEEQKSTQQIANNSNEIPLSVFNSNSNSNSAADRSGAAAEEPDDFIELKNVSASPPPIPTVNTPNITWKSLFGFSSANSIENPQQHDDQADDAAESKSNSAASFVPNVLFNNLSFRLDRGDSMVIIGKSGSGKSSLLRVIASLWPIQAGSIHCPMDKNKLFFLPQRSYLFNGTLLSQIAYPMAENAVEMTKEKESELLELLKQTSLIHLYTDYGWNDRTADWPTHLSSSECQRLSFVRMIFHEPLFCLADECTSTLSLEEEAAVMALSRQRKITFVSVAHRPSIILFHRWMLEFDEISKNWNKLLVEGSQFYKANYNNNNENHKQLDSSINNLSNNNSNSADENNNSDNHQGNNNNGNRPTQYSKASADSSILGDQYSTLSHSHSRSQKPGPLLTIAQQSFENSSEFSNQKPAANKMSHEVRLDDRFETNKSLASDEENNKFNQPINIIIENQSKTVKTIKNNSNSNTINENNTKTAKNEKQNNNPPSASASASASTASTGLNSVFLGRLFGLFRIILFPSQIPHSRHQSVKRIFFIPIGWFYLFGIVLCMIGYGVAVILTFKYLKADQIITKIIAGDNSNALLMALWHLGINAISALLQSFSAFFGSLLAVYWSKSLLKWIHNLYFQYGVMYSMNNGINNNSFNQIRQEQLANNNNNENEIDNSLSDSAGSLPASALSPISSIDGRIVSDLNCLRESLSWLLGNPFAYLNYRLGLFPILISFTIALIYLFTISWAINILFLSVLIFAILIQLLAAKSISPHINNKQSSENLLYSNLFSIKYSIESITFFKGLNEEFNHSNQLLFNYVEITKLYILKCIWIVFPTVFAYYSLSNGEYLFATIIQLYSDPAMRISSVDMLNVVAFCVQLGKMGHVIVQCVGGMGSMATFTHRIGEFAERLLVANDECKRREARIGRNDDSIGYANVAIFSPVGKPLWNSVNLKLESNSSNNDNNNNANNNDENNLTNHNKSFKNSSPVNNSICLVGPSCGKSGLIRVLRGLWNYSEPIKGNQWRNEKYQPEDQRNHEKSLKQGKSYAMADSSSNNNNNSAVRVSELVSSEPASVSSSAVWRPRLSTASHPAQLNLDANKPQRGVYFVPQSSYLTSGSLIQQIIYPHKFIRSRNAGNRKNSNNSNNEAEVEKELSYFTALLSDVGLEYLIVRWGLYRSNIPWQEVLSGGESQRIGLARLLYHKPRFAVLDECSSSLDLRLESQCMRAIASRGIELLSISTRPSQMQFHSRLMTLDGNGNYNIERI